MDKALIEHQIECCWVCSQLYIPMEKKKNKKKPHAKTFIQGKTEREVKLRKKNNIPDKDILSI